MTPFEICTDDLLRKKNDILDNNSHVSFAIDWLINAQDKTADGGVAAWYSLLRGWALSYVETTGYIITTFLDASRYLNNSKLIGRAIKMADFLVKMQLPHGGFRVHVPEKNREPSSIVFDTGQDILGLTDIYKETANKKYLESAKKAADWLISIQEKDGSWVKNTFGNTKHTYKTRVAWSLLKIYELTKDKKYRVSGIKNLDWALKNQKPNGWYCLNSLPDQRHNTPFTHTISYAAEGFLWSGLILKEKKYIDAAKKAADAILNYYREHDFVPGTFDEYWEPSDHFSCLTGDAQISIVWLKLFQITGNEKYLNSARRLNYYLKGTQNNVIKNREIKGGIKGSDPIYGDFFNRTGYSRMAYLNWATKFFVDSLILEDLIVEGTDGKDDLFVYKV